MKSFIASLLLVTGVAHANDSPFWVLADEEKRIYFDINSLILEKQYAGVRMRVDLPDGKVYFRTIMRTQDCDAQADKDITLYMVAEQVNRGIEERSTYRSTLVPTILCAYVRRDKT